MHKHFTKILTLILATGLPALSFMVHAQEQSGWSIGTAIVSSNASYRSQSSDTFAVPMINYEGENFYLRGITAGYYLQRQREQQLSLELSAEPFRFRPQDSADLQMRQLDRREFSGSASARYNRVTAIGLVSTRVGTDLTGRHNGQSANITYSYPFNREWGGEWQFSPRLGVDYRSKDWVRYYYGVSANEAARTGLSEYNGDHAFSPFIGLGGFTRLTPGIMLSGSVTLSRLSSAVTDSPMVSGRTSRTYFFTVSYMF